MIDTKEPLITRLKEAEMLAASRGDTETAALHGESIKHLTDMAGQLVEAIMIMHAMDSERDKWKALCEEQNQTMKETVAILEAIRP